MDNNQSKETSFFCIVDFDSTETRQPQSVVASTFREATSIENVKYNSFSVEKEDMLNEYTDTLKTTATVRLDVQGLRSDVESPFESWIDRKMNEHTKERVYGIEVNQKE
jgi:hypothetical protein